MSCDGPTARAKLGENAFPEEEALVTGSEAPEAEAAAVKGLARAATAAAAPKRVARERICGSLLSAERGSRLSGDSEAATFHFLGQTTN
jgi:hypothetical protein